MEEQIYEIVTEARQNKEKMMELILRFEGLIQKYAYNFYMNDREDVRQELQIAVIKAVKRMKYVHSDGECINFITNALYHSFLNLCKQYKKQTRLQITEPENFLLLNQEAPDRFTDIEYLNDFEKKLNTLPEIYTKIYKLLREGYSDKEIADRLNYSRQYINKIKKKIIL